MIVIGVLINLFGALTFQRANWAGSYSDLLSTLVFNMIELVCEGFLGT